MNWLSTLKNQTILLALVGLGAINGLLCVVMILRENSNATQIARLEREAKEATQLQSQKLAELKAELESQAKAARQSEQERSATLTDSLKNANSAIDDLRDKLKQTSGDLMRAQNQIDGIPAKLETILKPLNTAINDLQSAIAQFRTNHPWLVDTKQRPPWDMLFEKLPKDKKK